MPEPMAAPALSLSTRLFLLRANTLLVQLIDVPGQQYRIAR